MINPTKSRLLKQNTRTKEAGNAFIGGVIMDNTPNDFMSIPRIVKPDPRTIIKGSVVVDEPHPARSGSDFQPARFPACIVALPVVVAPFRILKEEGVAHTP